MTDPKVLVFDIETAPMLAYVWGRFKVNVSVKQVKEDWSIMAWAAKWLGAKKIMYMDQRHAKHIENDREILLGLWGLLNEADIVITQNGQSFDTPKINARFIMHGIKPPSPYKHIDTYRIAKRVANFTSNGLEYLTEKLCIKYKKLSHTKYPGMTLWTECLKGNKSAWREMEKYNKHDVLATEELYHKLKAWAPSNTPKPYSEVAGKCTTCGTNIGLTKWGYYRERTGMYQRYSCDKCFAYTKGERVSGL